jgi:DNA invertase Pin-like site-specific DNA recombinase
MRAGRRPWVGVDGIQEALVNTVSERAHEFVPRRSCSLAKAGEQACGGVRKRTSERANIMAVYGYTRVSTSRQAEEGESLDVQQRTIAGYALMLGLIVDRTFIERGVSGSVPLSERAEGSALLAVLKPGDVLITPKLDRMFRSALDALDVLAKLKGRNVSLHMIDLGGDVTGNGISKLVFTILSAVAEAERDRIRERITQVKRGSTPAQPLPRGHRPLWFPGRRRRWACAGCSGTRADRPCPHPARRRSHAPRDPGCVGGGARQEAVAGRSAPRARRPARRVAAVRSGDRDALDFHLPGRIAETADN